MLYKIAKTTYDDVNGIVVNKGKEHKLTKTQKNLLNYFIQNPGIILSKQTLMEEVWGRVITENSVDQIISHLRNYLEENPAKPCIIVTHFGKGISFEAQVVKTKKDSEQSNKNSKNSLWLMLLVALALFFVYWLNKTNDNPESNIPAQADLGNKKMLILPTTFGNKGVDSVKQAGIRSLMQSTFNNLDSEGQLLFDNASLSAQQAIEKHWRLEDDLLVIRSNITKNGEIYESIIELNDGINTYKPVRLSANNINDLVNNQMVYIADFSQSKSKDKDINLPNLTNNDKYILALGYKKLGDLEKAKKLIKEILFEDEENHSVRLILAEILYTENAYDESLSQLNTLKATDAYQSMAAEIELGIAKVNYAKKRFEQVIDDLTNFQAKHSKISDIKIAKIQLQLADAHLALSHLKTAMKFYKLAITKVDALLNPFIFAQSYFGQADVILKSSTDSEVFELYKKAYEKALLAQDIPFQIKALNKMSFIAMNNYEWEKAINLTKQVIALHEMGNDKNNLGIGLGNLVTILNLRGEFTQAQEVNERLGKLATEINSDTLQLHYLHYKAVLTMNNFDWISAQQLIDEQLQLAKLAKNYSMQLNNAFLQLELILLTKDQESFMPEWDKRVAKIKQLGFERYQVYMDLYLARYFALIGEDEKAIELFKNVSERTLQSKDIKIYVDAQTRMAKVLLKSSPKETLDLLNKLEQHNPHPNPYLDVKAEALYKLGKKIEALSILNQAKLVYHESWTAENQALLESIESSIIANQ
ncbi:MAG: winged helix-turn-helix domain-containing protein [Proteobacteria bacterium]|nr:winged helix-turn-helix domain-containing protein [Pseudomonadota bacterium]